VLGPVFMFCAYQTHFRRYRGHRVSISCFALLNSFSTVPSASGPVFMFCESELIFGGTEGVRSHCHVLCSRTCFWWCGGRRVPFLCFALSGTFSAIPRASSLVFIFCAPELVFGGTEGAGSRFHILHYRARFRW
jgi:hypothetical protein